MVGQPGFFDFDDRLRRLSDLGDQLEAFAAAVDFELFRPVLDAALAYADGAKGGRPPLDPVLMFKVLIIQAANGLSDERAEYLINDRLSFMRFLGLSLGDRVPDARTIWLFRERLTRAVIEGRPAIEVLFARFDATLREAGYIAMSEVHQGQAGRGWARSGDRSRHSRVRLPKPRQHQPWLRADPHLEGHRCRSLRGPPPARRAAR